MLIKLDENLGERSRQLSADAGHEVGAVKGSSRGTSLTHLADGVKWARSTGRPAIRQFPTRPAGMGARPDRGRPGQVDRAAGRAFGLSVGEEYVPPGCRAGLSSGEGPRWAQEAEV
jgi:hypothetical protein